MIITVDHGLNQAIDGLAEDASIAVQGDQAKVSVSTDRLIRAPRQGQTLSFADAQWRVERTNSRTAHLITFTCRKIAHG